MKKLIAILLVLCLAAGGAVGYAEYRQAASAVAPAAENAAQPQENAEAEDLPVDAEPAEIQVPDLDYERLLAEHDRAEVIATIGDREQTWGQYYDALCYQARQVRDYFEAMANYYGMAQGWNDVVEGDEKTYADLTAEAAGDTLRQFAAIEGFAEANGVELTEQNRADMARQIQDDMAAVCGEGATEEDFAAYLADIGMSREMYDRINTINFLYQENYKQIYGENGENLEDEPVMTYLANEGYLSADHILLMTVDPATQEELDEETVARKEAQARELAAELQAIQDPEKLLARFVELRDEHSEDSGKAVFPGGYTFTPGTMVGEFEEACGQLEEYQVSDPVRSDYGFHIILRLPLDPDALLFSSDGNPLTARATAANYEYGQRMQEFLDGLSIEYAEGFTVPDLSEYVIA